MTGRTHLTTAEEVEEEGSWLFTIRDEYDELDEVLLVPCDGNGEESEGDDGGGSEGDKEAVQAWMNRCTHEFQRLDRGFGAAMRDGQIICPKHGSMFDSCSGHCDNGDAAGTTLPSVDVVVELGNVYLVDDDVEFSHEGSIEDGEDGEDDDDDDMPSSTSHLGL
ncbi:Rieske (2Fe-2S) protein [Halorussus halophilus]|uniref:Rieske (2Fe-2S) protein n=1 Tax=Halorussus halophilus TaxID=2650975 RepID=UPI001CE42D1E|nr:Rieske 2Fe-2S domain-containing protein [Halorussus halophilus]